MNKISYSLKTAQLAQRLVESILSIPLLEMGSIRNEYQVKIQDLGTPFCEHILYLQIYPSSQDAHHWKNELKGYCSKIYRFAKRPDKPFSREELLRFLTDPGSIDEVMDNFSSKFKKISHKQAKTAILIAAVALCEAMSKKSKEYAHSLIDSLWP